ncbi:hypothetical protein MKX01_020792 [Papaver californicum]|nr:hypothetical protein MKX01_020792 [Papaver californicum]
MFQMTGASNIISRPTRVYSRESSPPLNWSPLSHSRNPTRYEQIMILLKSDALRGTSQHDETALNHEPHLALNSPDNEIENIHVNTDDERLPVSFNEHGQWNGSGQFATWIREITRAQIPLSKQCLENRKIKTETISRDAKTVEENKRRLPTYCKKEDWEAFITYNTSENFQKKSKQAAEARSQVKAQYTGGRKGIPTRWKELEMKSPTGEIYRPSIFLETHKFTPDDNPSSSKSLAAAKVALVKEAYDKDPLAQKCLATDVVTMLDIWR